MRAAAPTFLLAMVYAGAACQGAGGPAAGRSGDPFPIHALDESTAAALRQNFDSAADRARYVVALSPT